MKNAVLSLFLFGAVLSAAPVNVTFVNAGTPVVYAYGADVGPYTLNINGKNVAAMCMDDFLYVSGTWSANETVANSSNLNNTYQGNTSKTILGHSYTGSQLYTAEAYLFSEITKSGADRGDIQEAAWAIMDSNTLASLVNSKNTNVLNFVSDAIGHSSSFNASGYTIVSQVGAHNEQEFMIASAPEPSTYALFGSGILAVALSRLRRRKEVKA